MASLSLLSAVLDQPARLEDRARRDVAGLMKALESVTDPRKRRGRRFELVVVLALAVLAVCCGASSFAVVAGRSPTWSGGCWWGSGWGVAVRRRRRRFGGC